MKKGDLVNMYHEHNNDDTPNENTFFARGKLIKPRRYTSKLLKGRGYECWMIDVFWDKLGNPPYIQHVWFVHPNDLIKPPILCPECNSVMVIKKMPYTYPKGGILGTGTYLGEFEAEVCPDCKDIWFTEKSMKLIEKQAKKVGIWGKGTRYRGPRWREKNDC
jgi:hypothetical protein